MVVLEDNGLEDLYFFFLRFSIYLGERAQHICIQARRGTEGEADCPLNREHNMGLDPRT